MDEAAERTDVRRARAGSYADWAARPHVVTLAFVVMLGMAVLVRLLLTRSFPAPWIMGDELHYSELARSFASNGVMRLREEPSTLRSLYPVLISPAWLFNSVGTAYALAKVINVLLMTLAAVPFFLWARRLVRPTLALAGTLLFLLLPAALYANLIMTESAFLPAFLLSVLLAALALEHPTPMRQVLAIVSIALPVAIRAQGVVLVPILLTALLLKVLLDARASGRISFGSLLAMARAHGHARPPGRQARLRREALQPQSRRRRDARRGAEEIRQARADGHAAALVAAHHRDRQQDPRRPDRPRRITRKCWYANTRKSIGVGKAVPVPATLDWDLWQGPAPRQPYKDNVQPYNWHWFRIWGTGETLNNGTHEVDVCRWALGVDYPNRVTASGGRYAFKDDWQFYDTLVTGFEYDDKMISWECSSCNGMRTLQRSRPRLRD